MTYNEIIQELYHGKAITKKRAGDIAEEIDVETARISFRINKMIDALGSVLFEQGWFFDEKTDA